jgi:hypothetical protein
MVSFAEFQILQQLRNSELVSQTFDLDGNNEMLSLPIRADVQFINLNLAYALYLCPEMILEREGDALAK